MPILKKKTLLTHLWTNSSLVDWHCLWTNASKSDGMKGRPADKRSLTVTNLKDEKLKQNNQTKKKKRKLEFYLYLMLGQSKHYEVNISKSNIDKTL